MLKDINHRMMKAEEKAKELVCRMWGCDEVEEFDNILQNAERYTILDAKECALICVDEIIKNCLILGEDQFWEGVKQEIEKI